MKEMNRCGSRHVRSDDGGDQAGGGQHYLCRDKSIEGMGGERNRDEQSESKCCRLGGKWQ